MNERREPDVIYADMVVTRVLDAPVGAIWDYLTVPENFGKWWAPEQFIVSKAEVDVRVGGRYHWCMRGPAGWDGNNPCYTGTFSEVVPHRKLSYNVQWADEQGKILTAAEMGMDFPDESNQQIAFEALPDGRTILTVTEFRSPLNQMFAYSYAGLNQGIDRMMEHLNAKK